MEDRYKHLAYSHNSSAEKVVVVSPSDVSDLPFVSNGFWIVGGGAVRITTRSGDVVTLPEIPAEAIGWYWPILTTKIWATGTTATAIVAGTA